MRLTPQNFFGITLGDDFGRKVEQIKSRFNIDECSGIDIDSCCDRRLEKLEDKNFQIAVIDIRNSLGLDNTWHEPLVRYIIDDEIVPFDKELLPQVKVVLSENAELETWIKIDSNTNLPKLIQVFKILESRRPKTKDKEYKTFFRDYRIYSLAKERKTLSQISIIIDKEYPNSSPDGISIDTVKKVESDFRKKYDLGDGQNLSLE